MHRRWTCTMLLSLALLAACSGSADDDPADGTLGLRDDAPEVADSTAADEATSDGDTSTSEEAVATPDREPGPLIGTGFRLDRFDLSTPERVVEEFIAAHEDDDHLRSLLLYSGDAQQKFNGALVNFDAGVWQREFPRTTYSAFIESEHHSGSLLPSVARAMELADQDGLLIVDLSTAVIGESMSVDRSTIDVRVVVDGRELVVRTVQVASDQWRIAQVVLDGIDPDLEGPPILRRTCSGPRFVPLEGSTCPEPGSGELTAEIQAEIDRLGAEAGDDADSQVAAAERIIELVESTAVLSDGDICGTMQGVWGVDIDAADEAEVRARAEVLVQESCPGTLDYLFSDPDEARTTERFPATSLYGSLPLDTPESAVESFFAAWSFEAYLPVFLMLSQDAQAAMTQGGVGFGYVEYLARPARDIVSFDHDHAFPAMWFVETLEETSSIEGAHRLGPTDQVTLGEVVPIDWQSARWGLIEGRAVEVMLDDGPHTVVMVPSSSGRWRVAQIVQAPDEPDPTGPVFPPEG